MSELTLESYIITYSNYFDFEGKRFAFRKQILFDITNIPKAINLSYNNGCKGFWIGKKWLSFSAIKTIIKIENIDIDVSDLQWYQQIQLNEVFNI